jgi:A/G-specific adenine glycosylase
MRLSNTQVRSLRRKLLVWYGAHRRDLPWRNTSDPYCICVSEIMLQQTRVAVVVERYKRFLRRFPTVEHLARARTASVLAEWSGLGYYRRARNLHSAAKAIVREYSGKFPRDRSELLRLPGIGRYTSAAIASIAWNEPAAVVDGNVERVLSRLSGGECKGEQVWRAAQSLLDECRPGDFNQAMMELGATVCLPAQPRCTECPIRRFCRARASLPAQSRKSDRKKRELAYLLARRGRSVFLVRRDSGQALMPGMWELPQVASSNASAPALFTLRHSITTTDYRILVFDGSKPESSQSRAARPEARWIGPRQITRLPLTGLARKILTRAGII